MQSLRTIRSARVELDTERTYRAQSVLRDILPAIDNIERALAQQGESDEFKSLHKGVEMIYESLLHSLKENGLEVIEALDAPFDPNLHRGCDRIVIQVKIRVSYLKNYRRVIS